MKLNFSRALVACSVLTLLLMGCSPKEPEQNTASSSGCAENRSGGVGFCQC
jgi:hypothetical protein